jgi:hypothetical protein
MDIDNASLGEIIKLIEDGNTDLEIAAMKNYNSGSPVYSRLKIAGADKSSKRWNFSNVNQSMIDRNFWEIREEKKAVNENSLGISAFSEDQITALKTIADKYLNQSSDSDLTKYEMFGMLLFEHATYKNKDITTKQLNIPVPEFVMKRLDEFTNRSGLEKRFVVNKALETFLDLYQSGLKEV